jgi:hypothetical protein
MEPRILTETVRRTAFPLSFRRLGGFVTEVCCSAMGQICG